MHSTAIAPIGSKNIKKEASLHGAIGLMHRRRSNFFPGQPAFLCTPDGAYGLDALGVALPAGGEGGWLKNVFLSGHIFED